MLGGILAAQVLVLAGQIVKLGLGKCVYVDARIGAAQVGGLLAQGVVAGAFVYWWQRPYKFFTVTFSLGSTWYAWATSSLYR